MTDSPSSELPPRVSDKRLQKAAVDFINTVLEVERLRFDAERAHAVLTGPAQQAAPVANPSTLHILAESDSFLGAGFGPVDHARDGSARRWMGRVGSLLLPVDLSAASTLRVQGAGFMKRFHVDDLTIWLDDQPVQGTAVRKGLSRWAFEGVIPATPPRPYHTLRFQAPSTRESAKGHGGRASVAISALQIDPI